MARRKKDDGMFDWTKVIDWKRVDKLSVEEKKEIIDMFERKDKKTADK